VVCAHEHSCEPTIRPPTVPIQFKAWFDEDVPETAQEASVYTAQENACMAGGGGVSVLMRAFQLQAHVGEPTECRTRSCRAVHSGAGKAGIETCVCM
jgi:hypothetical protein